MGTAAFGRAGRIAILAAFAALVVLRLPGAWAHGRFLAEEAPVFLAYAWHRPALDALLRPFGGYWNMAADASTLAVARAVRGGWLPLAAAPYATMLVALAGQMVPALLIVTGRAAWLRSRAAVVAALLMVAIMPATEEVFANVLHIQFHLALGVALVLALDVPVRRPTRIAYALLLVAAPLCGPGAIVLLPLFGLRALADRDPGRAVQLLWLGMGAAIQLALFYTTSPVRSHPLDMVTLGAVGFVRLIVLPLAGFPSGFAAAVAVDASREAGGIGWRIAAAVAAVALAALLVDAARRREAAAWLVAAALLVGGVSFGRGMIVTHHFDLFSIGAGERYNFLPLVLLGLATVAMATRRDGPRRRLYALIAAIVLVQGVLRYPHPLPEYDRGPSWPVQAAAWSRDHAHPLRIWGATWTADLSDRDDDCLAAPAGRPLPLYCEAGWVAANRQPPLHWRAPRPH